MNEFRLWLNEEMLQKKREHAALFEASESYIEMMKLNELEHEISDLRIALTKYLKFERVTGGTDAKST